MRSLPWFLLVAACGPADADGVATADVVGVRVTGDAGAYTFAVSVRSDETGCDRYADWWEVLSADGSLVYRRVLDHSHPGEQPFERDGGPVQIAADERVLVRAHLSPDGYGGEGMEGTVADGFVSIEPAPGFALDLATEPPLPAGCLF
ncbi:MAG: hypothetical protein KC621_26380 [Myxococcales bacterium]|nr:hypothetical protein [Myxococcales bacterium]